MCNPTRVKLIAAIAVVALIVGFVAFTGNRRSRNAPDGLVESSPTERTNLASGHLRESLSAEKVLAETQELAVVDFDWRQALTNGVGPAKLPHAEVEKYLERNRRSAASLLAAAHALDDTQYLKEAATNFPNDPRVQWSVLAHNLFPEERRKWLDLFKTAAPGNSAASYLSARDYFNNGQTDLAINEMIAAGSQSGFDNYAWESKLDQEELGMAAGRSRAQAMLSSGGWAQETQFADFKALAQDIRGLEVQYVNQGDAASAERLAQIGLSLGSRFQTGDGARFAISQLVGNAIEAIVLDPLDQNAAYDFLDGKSPAEVRAEFIKQKNSIRDLRQVVLQAMPDMTDAEIMSYLERQRLYGEVNAMRWLQSRINTAGPPDAKQ